MIVTYLCRYFAGKHRESEVTLELISGPVVTSSSVALPTSVQLVQTIPTAQNSHSVAHGRAGQVYVGTQEGVRIITTYGGSHAVISTNTCVYRVGVSGDDICTLRSKNDELWIVDLYDTDYRLTRSWEYKKKLGGYITAQMALRKESVLISDGRTITEYKLNGRVKREVSYEEIQHFLLSLCAMLRSDDVIGVDGKNRLHRLNFIARRCVWSKGMDQQPAVCCDETDRVFVAVKHESGEIAVAVLDSNTGEFRSVRQTFYVVRVM